MVRVVVVVQGIGVVRLGRVDDGDEGGKTAESSRRWNERGKERSVVGEGGRMK